MRWLHKFKRMSSIVLAGMLLTAIVPPAGAAGTDSTVDNGCLSMVGAGSVPVTSIERNQMVTINYTLDPNGTHTVTLKRDPVDVAFVADVSGSMDYYMNKNDNRTPVRIDILKQASRTLTEKFKTVNMNDRLGLIKFSDTASKVKDLTTDYQSVQSAINSFDAGGSTNIDDGLTKAKNMLTAADTKPIKQVILLTDGKATAWTDENDRNKQKSGEVSSANAAKASADALAASHIKVFTIALALPGSDEVDLDLLQYIADKTGGVAYQASSTAELASIFDNITKTIEAPAKLSSVVLRQPIPEGFILAPEGNASNVSYDPVKHEVAVYVGDIPFPFDQDKIDLAVKLIPESAAGEYPIQDAKVTYKDACDANQQFNINFGTSFSVSIRVIDKYGNIYLGNTQGELQRLRTGDKEKQWTIDETNSAVTDIKFEDPDQHSIVLVSYRDGTKSRWDLKPTAPTGFVLKDASGAVISDEGWHQGPGTISAFTGSKLMLPESTVYANEDFTTHYIAGFQYRIGNGEWLPFNSATGVVLPDGKDISLNARAYTNSISASANTPILGAVAAGKVSLDSSGPIISWSKTSGDPSEDAEITITATETLSPVTNIKVWFDGKPASAITAGAGRMIQIGNTYTFSFKLSDVPGYTQADSRIGWHQIEYEATSAGGTSKTNPDYFVVNPGPTGSLTPVDYTVGTDIADRPVTIQVTASHPVVAKYAKPAFTVKDKYYLIKSDASAPEDTAAWKKLPASRFTVTTEPNTTVGTYYVYLKLVDDQGISTVTGPVVIAFDTEQNRY